MSEGPKDEEPQLELQKQQEPEAPRKIFTPRLQMAVLVLGACCALAATAVDLPALKSAAQPQLAATSTGGGDKVPLERRAQIDGLFSAYTGRLAPLALEKNKDAFMAQAFLSAEEKAQLWAELENGDRRLTAVTLWDNFDQDGDVVTVQSEGVTLTVPILHAPTTVYLPYRPGAALSITGARDGGGGITAAIETMSGAVPLPVMTVGQTIVIPLL
jgi:hypothetical protein